MPNDTTLDDGVNPCCNFNPFNSSSHADSFRISPHVLPCPLPFHSIWTLALAGTSVQRPPKSTTTWGHGSVFCARDPRLVCCGLGESESARIVWVNADVATLYPSVRSNELLLVTAAFIIFHLQKLWKKNHLFASPAHSELAISKPTVSILFPSIRVMLHPSLGGSSGISPRTSTTNARPQKSTSRMMPSPMRFVTCPNGEWTIGSGQGMLAGGFREPRPKGLSKVRNWTFLLRKVFWLEKRRCTCQRICHRDEAKTQQHPAQSCNMGLTWLEFVGCTCSELRCLSFRTCDCHTQTHLNVANRLKKWQIWRSGQCEYERICNLKAWFDGQQFFSWVLRRYVDKMAPYDSSCSVSSLVQDWTGSLHPCQMLLQLHCL